MARESSHGRVLAILDLFTEDRLEWSFDEMMAALGYSRPTLYRYLRTLREAGFLTALPNARFMPGPKVVELDYLLRKSDPLTRQGAPILTEITARWPCSALLVRWYGTRLLCVASESSTPTPLSSYPRGRPMPLARGAISRAIMAYLPRRRQLTVVADNLAAFASVDLGATVTDVLDSFRGVRRRGYAIGRGEVTPGVIGLAAPVFQDGAEPVAALCATLADAEADAAGIEEIGARVRRAAADLSARLQTDTDAQLREGETTQ